MKRALFILALFFAFATAAHAQQGNTITFTGAGAPSGNCAFMMFWVNSSTADFYDCAAGMWVKVTGGGGGGGTPCTTTALSLQYNNAGAFGCVAQFTYSGSTVAGASGTLNLTGMTLVTLRVGAGATTSTNGDQAQDSTTGYWHVWQNGNDRLMGVVTAIGNSGQVPLSNADGTFTPGDPIVSGPDARGAAQTKNPVAGLGGIDYGTGCGGGPCVQEGKVDSSGNQFVQITGPFGQALAAASLPVVLTAAQLSTLTPLSTVAVTQSTSPWVSSCTAANCAVNAAQVGGANIGAATTPADAMSGVNAAPVYNFGMLFNGMTYDRMREGTDSGSLLVNSPTAANFKVTTTQGTSPWVDSCTAANCSINLANWAGTALGTPTNFGTTPGAVVAGSVNASLFQGTTLVGTGNPLQVSLANTGSNSTALTVAGGSNIFEVSPTTAANLVTNPFFTQISNGTNSATFNSTTYTSKYGLDSNILGLDGAVFSATNALFGQITDGTNAMGAMTNFGSTPSTAKALNANVSLFSGTTSLGQTGGALNVNISSGVAPGVADNSTFTQGTTSVTPIGAIYNPTPETITAGNVGAPVMDASRRLMTNDANGPNIVSVLSGILTASQNYRIAGTFNRPITSTGDALDVNLKYIPSTGFPEGGIYNSPQPTVNPGQPVEAQYTVHGASIVATGTDPLTVGCSYTQTTNIANPLAPLSLQPGANANCQVDAFGRLLVINPDDQAILAALNASRTVGNARLTGVFNRPITSTGDALDVNIKSQTNNADPCTFRKSDVAISQTGTTLLVAGTGGAYIFVCYARVVAGAAEIPSFVEGTGATCGTNTVAVSGSTTAANGESYAANGGFSGGSGNGTIMSTKVAGDSLCLQQSGSNRLSGNITFVVSQ
jgi:hypothetical protein